MAIERSILVLASSRLLHLESVETASLSNVSKRLYLSRFYFISTWVLCGKVLIAYTMRRNSAEIQNKYNEAVRYNQDGRWTAARAYDRYKVCISTKHALHGTTHGSAAPRDTPPNESDPTPTATNRWIHGIPE